MTKSVTLQEDYLRDLEKRAHQLMLVRQSRKAQLYEMKKTFETLQKMDGYTVQMSVDFDFGKLDESNVKLIATTLDGINVKMQDNRQKLRANIGQDKPKEIVTTHHVRRNNKIRSRSASELTASSARTLMSSGLSRG